MKSEGIIKVIRMHPGQHCHPFRVMRLEWLKQELVKLKNLCTVNGILKFLCSSKQTLISCWSFFSQKPWEKKLENIFLFLFYLIVLDFSALTCFFPFLFQDTEFNSNEIFLLHLQIFTLLQKIKFIKAKLWTEIT